MELLIIFLSIALLIFSLTLFKNDDSTQSIVSSINVLLRKLDNSNTESDATFTYNSIIRLLGKLPDGVKLNNLSISEARRVVRQEYEERLSVIRKNGGKSDENPMHTLSKGGITMDVYDSGRVKGRSSINAFGEHKLEWETTLDKIEEKQNNADAFNRETVYKYGNKSVIDLGNGMIRVKWSYLNKKYLGIMDEDLFWKDDGYTDYVDIPKNTLESMESRRKEREIKNRSIARMAEMNNQGIELEKRGEIEEAIKMYEKNISYGDCDTPHTYNRLMILYRKQKEYKKELQIIDKAISMFPNQLKYLERKDKLLAKCPYLKE